MCCEDVTARKVQSLRPCDGDPAFSTMILRRIGLGFRVQGTLNLSFRRVAVFCPVISSSQKAAAAGLMLRHAPAGLEGKKLRQPRSHTAHTHHWTPQATQLPKFCVQPMHRTHSESAKNSASIDFSQSSGVVPSSLQSLSAADGRSRWAQLCASNPARQE